LRRASDRRPVLAIGRESPKRAQSIKICSETKGGAAFGGAARGNYFDHPLNSPVAAPNSAFADAAREQKNSICISPADAYVRKLCNKQMYSLIHF
jgi:hypothetical protein